MSDDPKQAELDAMITSGLALLGIRIDPDWQDAVRFHLGTIFRLAEPVLDFPLPDEADPAPIFRA